MRLLACLILLLCGTAFAAHNPATPDTLYANNDASDAYIYGKSQFFKGARPLTVGTSSATNSSSASVRTLFYNDNTSVSSSFPDTLGRFYWYSDTLNVGDFRAKFTASRNIDSTIWSVLVEGRVDSGECTDSIYVIPKLTSVTGSSGPTGATFNDVYTGATDGYDTLKVSRFKKPSGTTRVNVTMNSAYTDSIEAWIARAGNGLSARLGMVCCADFKADSTLAGLGNYIESLSVYYNEQTDITKRPYLLVYWTDLSTSGPVGIVSESQVYDRGGWREIDRGNWRSR